MRRDILLAMSGIAFILLTLLPVLLPHERLDVEEDPASADALPPSEEIAAFFARNYAMQQAQTLLHLLGLAAFCVFAGRLSWIVAAGGASSTGAVAAIAAAGMVAIMGAAMAFVSALLRHADVIEPRLMLALYDMGWDLHFKVSYLAPVFVGAISWGGLRSGALPRWVAWSGFAASVLILLSTFGNLGRASSFVQYPAFFVLLLWCLGVSIAALIGSTRKA